jgi:hypothetical protein
MGQPPPCGSATVEVLIHFASADPRTEAGCLFGKMKSTPAFAVEEAASGAWKRGIAAELRVLSGLE